MATPTQKTCHGVLLPAEAFAVDSTSADGLQRLCRDCKKKLRAAWGAKNKDHEREYDRKRRSKASILATAPTPSRASPSLGEGGEPRNEVATNDGFMPPADLRAQSKVNPPAFGGKREDTERLAAQSVTPTVASTTTTPGFADLPHAAIVRSKTNPRTHFDEAFIKDLAASIRANGVLQAILVRPLPGSRLQETLEDLLPGQPRPTHEVVAGEQRWRAAGIAGLRAIPAMIRNLTDAQVLEIQLVENLKRRDLHPMEEAEGYGRLRDTVGLTADDIAEKIGKGRAYVYKTLKLLDLEPESREAFYEGKLTRSTAELVAMRQPNLQLQVLKEITAPDFHGEPMSFRKAKAHIDDRYMLRLGTAAFKITDAELVPAAGSCRVCPKRSGANPELFDDVAHADTCTDPSCFAEKKDAHYLRIRTQAEARGQTVITGREAKEIMPDSNTLRGYTKVDDHQALGGQMKTLRKVLGKDMPTPTLIEDPKTHEMVEVLPTVVVGKLLKEQGIGEAPTVETNEAAAQRDLAEKFEKTWRREAVEKIFAALKNDVEGGFNAPVLRQLALMLVDGLTTEDRNHTCKLLELGRIAAREAIESHIVSCPEEDVDTVLLLLLVQHDASKDGAADRIDTVASEYGVDTNKIRAGVKASMKKAASDKKVDGAAAAVVAQAAPTKPARKPKATAAEASAAIAAQLQAAGNPNAFQAGQRVRLKTDLRKGVDVFNTRGVEAEVMHALGDRAWMVQPSTLSFALSADYTEMESIEP
jgi:ParB/RepB/Spo0J family partition protein